MEHEQVPATTRNTRQREALMDILRSAKGFRSAQELHARLNRRGGRVGLATVYRNLQALAESGQVDVLRTNEGEAIYRLCRRGRHHHHLVCQSCGASVEIESQDVEKWAASTARRHGFTSVTHVAELYGVCGSCSGESA
jgi:Fur family ferric uptake transcriptional regulator